MATTIKLKNGSGAPLAGDLVQGEPALDLTNKRLYTEDSGGTVIEVGTNPSTLTVDNTSDPRIRINNSATSLSANTVIGGLEFYTNDASGGGTGVGASIDSYAQGNFGSNQQGLSLRFSTRDSGSGETNTERMRIDSSGNVIIKPSGRFYLESSSGYSPFLSEASNALTVSTDSTERMRIDSSGTVILNQSAGAADNTILRITGGTAGFSTLHLADTADINIGYVQYDHTNNALTFASNNAERMRIDSSGNVGIGDSSPTAVTSNATTLEIKGGVTTKGGAIKLNSSDESINSFIYPDSTNGLSINMLTAHPMRFLTSGTERMRIDASGNLGLGTTAPSSYGGGFVVDDLGINILTASNSSPGTNKLSWWSDSNGISQNAFISVVNDGATTNTGEFVFHTRNASNVLAERMRIDASGNVGIGTSSITAFSGYKTLHFKNTAGDAIQLNETDGGVINQILCTDSNGGKVLLGARSNHPTIFCTNDTERARIDTSGNLLVGCTAVPSASVAGFAVRDLSNGWIHTSYDSTNTRTHHNFFNPNGSVGTIQTSGSSTLYNTSSDQRLKDNIVDAPAGNIDAIRVRSFDWKTDGTHQTYGMVAQELVDVAPEAVSQGETEDDMWGVDYSKLVPMMIKEIQDLKAEVAALKGA